MKGKGDNGGRLYEFSDKAVDFLHRFMASNNLRNTDLVRRFDIMPATVCKLLSTTRHPKRVQDGTYQILMQFCPALEPLMPQVKRTYVDRHRDRAGRPSNAEVLLRARLEKISADKLLQEVMLAVTDLEADEPGLDQETLRLVRLAISAVRRKYAGEEQPTNKDAEASK